MRPSVNLKVTIAPKDWNNFVCRRPSGIPRKRTLEGKDLSAFIKRSL